MVYRKATSRGPLADMTILDFDLAVVAGEVAGDSVENSDRRAGKVGGQCRIRKSYKDQTTNSRITFLLFSLTPITECLNQREWLAQKRA